MHDAFGAPVTAQGPDLEVLVPDWRPSIDDRDGPRYVAIADAIADAVGNGALSPGDRLPTHRDLAQALGVTVGTVTRGYAEARRRGITVGEVGRGTFIKAPEDAMGHWVRPSEVPASPWTVNLSHSIMLTNEADEGRRLAETLQAVTRELDLSAMMADYAPGSAVAAHREIGAHWVATRVPHADGRQVSVTAGAQHGMLASLAAVCRPGDVVLAEQLTYPGIKSVAQTLGLQLVGVDLDEDGITPDALGRALETHQPAALYLVPTLHNPTTRTLSEARRDAIAALLRAHDTVLIEDDAHGWLPPDAPAPLATRIPEQTVFLATASKVMAPGLRVGFCLSPDRWTSRIEAAIRGTMWMPSPLMTEVAARWIADGTVEALLQARRAEAAARHAIAAEVLGHVDLWSNPHAYYVWLHLPEPWRREEFVLAAAQRGVHIVGAEAFAVGRHQVPHAVRISLGSAPSRDDLRRGLLRLAELLRSGQGDCGRLVV